MLRKLILTVLFCLPLVYGYPSGAPPSACDNMVPGHGSNKPQPNDTSPYQIIQETDSYNPGDHIAVYVNSPVDTPFKGLMVQAFDPDTGDTIGKFMEGNGLHDIEKCSSMTHSDPSDKKSATLIWIAPDDKSGKVNFR
ncbi:putative defense protein 3 [Parasteatoda tepidariorum]|uniref:putative defense protein 3 n=1 Tax=Parasteatoda tepidariorum TaxID=114398 RepID=UPI001C720BAA|nr:putative defense protein 3 [Parasteatoda tepidariorum]XP_042905616.1 putative defense protein 3 [Parasteatoda tepidariorum]XP_042905619.1 putative defense protein 3 [Parasteatoda tepidariorum]